jgi:hypothetical protein
MTEIRERAARMTSIDVEYFRFYKRACAAIGDATTSMRSISEAEGISNADLSMMLASACLRAAALALTWAPEIAASEFDGVLERNLTAYRKSVGVGEVQQ